MLKSAIEYRRIRSGELELATWIQGNADGPTLLMVHGYPDDHRVWDKVIEHLAADYRIVTYDTRGSGQSDKPETTRDFRLEYLAGDLANVVDAVSPDQPVHLIAHDWGSIQSWEAVTSPRLKGRIASFTSMSGPCLDHAAHWMRDRFKRPTPASLLAVGGQLIRSWYIMLFHLPLLAPTLWRLSGKFWPAFIRLTEGVDTDLRPTQIRDGIRGIALYRANFLDRLFRPGERIAHAPVQVIVPMKDLFVSPKISDDLGKWVPRLTRRNIASGHWLPLKDPALLASHIREFIEALAKEEHHE